MNEPIGVVKPGFWWRMQGRRHGSLALMSQACKDARPLRMNAIHKARYKKALSSKEHYSPVRSTVPMRANTRAVADSGYARVHRRVKGPRGIWGGVGDARLSFLCLLWLRNRFVSSVFFCYSLTAIQRFRSAMNGRSVGRQPLWSYRQPDSTPA
jgi:hypothetical protein